MKRKAADLFALGVIGLLLTEAALGAASNSDFSKPAPLSGSYILYGGELGDWQPPPPHGAKVSLEIDGKAAERLFAQLGARAKHLDCAEGGDEMRQIGDLDCVHHTNGRTECHIGIDLKSGKSVTGELC